MKHLALLLLFVGVPACAAIDRARDRTGEPVTPASDMPGAANAKSVDALDATTSAEKTAALAAGAGGGDELGRVTVSLGSPAEAGFWLRSALVTSAAKGRVRTDDGASIAVELLPGTGSAQLSLAAFRTLGLPLTGLPQVTVFIGK